MTTLKVIRHDLAEFIESRTQITTYPAPSSDVVTPCFIVQPPGDDDYVTGEFDGGKTAGAEEVRLQLVALVEAGGDPGVALDALDDMLDQLRPVLQFLRSPLGLKYSYGPVGPWSRWTVGQVDHSGAAMNITTKRTIERPGG